MHTANGFPLRTRRAVLAAGGAALVGCATLGAVALGVANAQSAPTFGPAFATAGAADVFTYDSAQLKDQHDKFITTLASKLGVSSDKLQQALKDTQKEVGPGPLMIGFGAPGIGAQGAAIAITGDLTPAAKVIGISEDQLRKELAGKSLTDVARAHNVDPQKVASEIKSVRRADLDKAVQSGKLPADMASTITSNLDQEVDMLMTMVRPASGAFGEFNVRIVRNSSDDGPGT
jgi:hypothetical protein